LRFVLWHAGISADHALKGLVDERGQGGLLKLPHIPAGDSLRQWQIFDLGQDRTGVNPAGHAVHGKAHARVAIPNRPQDRRRPAVFGQR